MVLFQIIRLYCCIFDCQARQRDTLTIAQAWVLSAMGLQHFHRLSIFRFQILVREARGPDTIEAASTAGTGTLLDHDAQLIR